MRKTLFVIVNLMLGLYAAIAGDVNRSDKYVNAVAFGPDGKVVASATGGGVIHLWDVKTGSRLRTLEDSERVFSVMFSPDGKTLFSSNGDQAIKQWDMKTGALLRTLRHCRPLNGLDGVNSALSSNGLLLASGANDKTVKLWDAKTGALLRTLRGHRDIVHSVAFTSDGKTVASSSNEYDGIKLWDASTGTPLWTGSLGTGDIAYSVAFSPDGKVLASAIVSATMASQGYDDSKIELWDVKTGALMRTLRHTGVMSVAFSGDGSTLASGGDKTALLWDVKTGTLLRTLSGHSSTVRSVSFSPDGSTLATGSFDNTVKLWDLKTGTVTRTLAQP